MAAAEYFCAQADGTHAEASASVQGPDFNQYASHHKSWAADLFVNGNGVHVKTMTIGAAIRWGLSWVFQKSDKTIRDPQPMTELGAFMLATETDIRLIALRPIETIKPLLKPLKSAHFTSKIALYAHDIL